MSHVVIHSPDRECNMMTDVEGGVHEHCVKGGGANTMPVVVEFASTLNQVHDTRGLKRKQRNLLPI